MSTVELFTIGGGEYVVNVLNAVAAWTGSGGYKSLIQVVMVMGLGYAVLIVAFNADWRAWLNWFLQATLMYMVLMVPRMDVHVTDRINPGLAPAQVANVPMGLALMASFTSQVGDYLVRSSELVFGLPGDLNYSRNGMIYGSRLFEATQSLRIRDPEFAANLDEHFRQCVFYDVLLGRTSMETLANANDIWTVIGPGSQARAQRFLTRDGSGQVSSTIETCRDAYARLSSQWTAMTDDLGRVFGRQLYPKQSAELAKAKLFADLPVAYRYLTGISASASDILKQSLVVNAMGQAMHGMAGASGTGQVDVYAQTRAEIQTRRTYGSIAHSAMKWVPILNIVLTVVFYALFPVLFPLFLMPKSGPVALKGYLTGFFYLAAWGPLYVVLHMILMLKGAGELAAAGGSNGLTRGETLSNQASESISNAVSRFTEFRRAVSTDRSIADSYGAEDRSNITSSFNEVDQASRMLQARFGLRAEVADSIATEKFVSGSIGANAGMGGKLGAISAGFSGSLSGGAAKRWTENDVVSVSRDGARIEDALESWSANRGWSQNRDAFERSVATSSRSDVSSSASGISSSIIEAQSYSREARRFFEVADRLETRWSARGGEGVSGSLNTSDAFLNFARTEIANTPLVYSEFDPSNAAHWQSDDPQTAKERDLLMAKYVEHIGAAMRAEVEGRLAAPDADGLARPAASSAYNVRASGAAAAETVPTLRGVSDNKTFLGRKNSILTEVSDVQARGAAIIQEKREDREADTARSALGLTAEDVERAREWSRSALPSSSERN